ncbi:YybH family protein [Steroidobacter sp.]|uniref:YybH family protein n=1 Tax=Steroidobacter sp. TaxID=1978227 RepID=UPI001A561728|nr:nuclear transport factor 2 family protein [Steroidobacter sp.]MBL8270034.1 nuclear transport factor 2 family protein [Steroidobacter sp.]
MAEQSFEEFLQHRRRVATAFVNGDPKPLREISASTDPATFFGPGGGLEHGNAQVVAGNEKAARQFQKGGSTELELLHSGSDGDLGYWTGFQHASLNLEGHVAPTPMKLRVTEVFRREKGQWKLMHRHADPLADVKPAN